MHKIFLVTTLVALASLNCGLAYSQSTTPAANSPKAANPSPLHQPATTLAPSAMDKVENWTWKQWNAAKVEWSENKAKWTACNERATHQKLSGRESWPFLYDCMTKV